MTIVHLVRPALDPERDLELRMRDCGHGLSDFVQAMSPPCEWLQIEILDADAETPQVPETRAVSRR